MQKLFDDIHGYEDIIREASTLSLMQGVIPLASVARQSSQYYSSEKIQEREYQYAVQTERKIISDKILLGIKSGLYHVSTTIAYPENREYLKSRGYVVRRGPFAGDTTNRYEIRWDGKADLEKNGNVQN